MATLSSRYCRQRGPFMWWSHDGEFARYWNYCVSVGRWEFKFSFHRSK